MRITTHSGDLQVIALQRQHDDTLYSLLLTIPYQMSPRKLLSNAFRMANRGWRPIRNWCECNKLNIFSVEAQPRKPSGNQPQERRRREIKWRKKKKLQIHKHSHLIRKWLNKQFVWCYLHKWVQLCAPTKRKWKYDVVERLSSAINNNRERVWEQPFTRPAEQSM